MELLKDKLQSRTFYATSCESVFVWNYLTCSCDMVIYCIYNCIPVLSLCNNIWPHGPTTTAELRGPP